MKLLAVSAMVCLGLLLGGCTPKKVATMAPQAPETVAPAEAQEAQKELAPQAPETVQEAELAKVQKAPQPSPPRPVQEVRFEDIYFDFDRYEIKPEAKPVLKRLARWLLQNGHVKLLIEGHCDERGTNEYNIALGDRRAKAVQSYLMALGVEPQRLQTISYGEERPLCTEKNEACWSRNRRAHFVPVEDETR
jgi:peptidoglycan-associated lipoprotein